MLVRSNRYTSRDLDQWRLDESRDALNAKRLPLDRMADSALDELDLFARDGWCWAGTSWGKDSAVLAHLCHRLLGERGTSVPLWWIRIEPNSNPDSPLVRDAFLRSHNVDYHESSATCDVNKLRYVGERAEEYKRAYDEATRTAFGASYWDTRHISGIRAEESGARRMRARIHGIRTEKGCAPLLHWSTEAVFAYLFRHGLPVHPAYACTMAGAWERDRLRVTALCGEEGSNHGRDAWEQRYYGRELRRLQCPG